MHGLPIECDKPKLREVLDRVVAEKAQLLRKHGRQVDWRFYFAVRSYFTRLRRRLSQLHAKGPTQ